MSYLSRWPKKKVQKADPRLVQGGCGQTLGHKSLAGIGLLTVMLEAQPEATRHSTSTASLICATVIGMPDAFSKRRKKETTRSRHPRPSLRPGAIFGTVWVICLLAIVSRGQRAIPSTATRGVTIRALVEPALKAKEGAVQEFSNLKPLRFVVTVTDPSIEGGRGKIEVTGGNGGGHSNIGGKTLEGAGGCLKVYAGQPCIELFASEILASSKTSIPFDMPNADLGIQMMKPYANLWVGIPVDEKTRHDNVAAFLKAGAAKDREKLAAQPKPKENQPETEAEATMRKANEKMLHAMETADDGLVKLFSGGYFANRVGTYEFICKYWWPDGAKKMHVVESAPVVVKVRDDGRWPGDTAIK